MGKSARLASFFSRNKVAKTTRPAPSATQLAAKFGLLWEFGFVCHFVYNAVVLYATYLSCLDAIVIRKRQILVPYHICSLLPPFVYT